MVRISAQTVHTLRLPFQTHHWQLRRRQGNTANIPVAFSPSVSASHVLNVPHPGRKILSRCSSRFWCIGKFRLGRGGGRTKSIPFIVDHDHGHLFRSSHSVSLIPVTSCVTSLPEVRDVAIVGLVGRMVDKKLTT